MRENHTMLFEPIKTQAKITNKVIVAFSGGKDSIVTLDLCMKHFKEVKVFYMYKVPNVKFIEKTLNFYEKKYNIEIYKVPHPELSMFLRYGTYRTKDTTLPVLDLKTIYNHVRNKYNIDYIAFGERINDSLFRLARLKNSGSTNLNSLFFFPIMYWNKQQVYAYIKKNKLLLPKDSKLLGHSFRSLASKELKIIKENFPNDYEQIKRFFPLIDVSIFHSEKYNHES